MKISSAVRGQGIAGRREVVEPVRFAAVWLRDQLRDADGTAFAIPSGVRTDSLETTGLALLISSIALFAATVSIYETMGRPQAPRVDVDAARTVAIAIRARADGRASHADSLLASLAARRDSGPPPADGSTVPTTSDVAGTDISYPVWLAVVAVACGSAGLVSVCTAARRRRRALRLVSEELGHQDCSDNPGTLVVGLLRMRVERELAVTQLRLAHSRLERPGSDSRASARCDQAPLTSGSTDPELQPFPELGRIVEISTVESDRHP